LLFEKRGLWLDGGHFANGTVKTGGDEIADGANGLWAARLGGGIAK